MYIKGQDSNSAWEELTDQTWSKHNGNWTIESDWLSQNSINCLFDSFIHLLLDFSYFPKILISKRLDRTLRWLNQGKIKLEFMRSLVSIFINGALNLHVDHWMFLNNAKTFLIQFLAFVDAKIFLQLLQVIWADF